MQESVTYNGRDYRLEYTGEPKGPYILHGPRATYALIRNGPNPDMLFPVATGNGKLRVPRGWFTDKGGTLRQVS
jgi:hypothetical protein